MSKIGIICDFNNLVHPLARSYYWSVFNLYGQAPIIVTNANDLNGIDLLFVGDNLYGPHKTILQSQRFIQRCNDQRIKVVVFTTEKMFDGFFPRAVDDTKRIQKIRNLYHYAVDPDDCKKLGIKLCRNALSKHFAPALSSLAKHKTDTTIFIGHTGQHCKSYTERDKVLHDVNIPISIQSPTVRTWEEYMTMLSAHRFVFSPIGNGNHFVMRFYEILAVGSIPIHQVRSNTLEYYDIEAQ